MALGDIWHKTLVYFGIAEEDDEYEEETLAPQEELEQSYRERPNVKKI
jgi:cell division inhibitor SepF